MTYTSAEQPKSVVTANRSGTATTYNYKHTGADSNELLQETTPDGTYTFNYGRPGQTKVPTIEAVSLSGVGTASVLNNDPSTGQPMMLAVLASAHASCSTRSTTGGSPTRARCPPNGNGGQSRRTPPRSTLIAEAS